MWISCILIILSALLLSVFFINVLKRFSLKFKVLASAGIPSVGGIAIAVSFISVSLLSLGLFFYQGLSRETLGIIVSSALMFIFGLLDDWRELSIWTKFLVQTAASILLILFGIRTHIVYIGSLLNIVITFIWVIGLTNAFNHLDVMDGLSSCAAITASAAFLAVAILNNDVKTVILTLGLIGAMSGFLIYNLPPARIYMGNSGSHFLGFVLAAIALAISYAPLERKIALLSPALILGLPIFDTAFLILTRLSQKKVPFKKSDDHLVLRLLKSGRSKDKTLFLMFSLAVFFSLSGVMVSQVSNLRGIVIIASVILLSIMFAKKMCNTGIDG